MLKSLVIFLLCAKVYSLINENQLRKVLEIPQEDAGTNAWLLNFLRKSGQRIAEEAKELTKDLKHVVDAVENSNYYLMIGYGNDNRKKGNGTLTYKFQKNEKENFETVKPAESVKPFPTTTKEESNAILQKSEITQSDLGRFEENENRTATEAETVPQNSEFIPENSTETLLQKPHVQKSAFNSILLTKILEAARKAEEPFQFSTEWAALHDADSSATNDDTYSFHSRKKRQAEIGTEPTLIEPPALQQSQPAEMNQCISKWDLEQHKFSEKKHLDGLQKELEKMEELIQILREQQHILDNMSDIDEKYYEYLNHSLRAGNIAEQHRLVELLELLNSKLTNSTLEDEDNATIAFQHFEEISRLKFEVEGLKRMVEKLPSHSQEIEKKLTKEMEKQRMEIFDIKKTLRHMTSNGKITMNNSTPRASESNEPVDPKYIQQQIKTIQDKIEELISKGNQEDPVLREGQQNPETVYLLALKDEVEHLKALVEKSLQLQQEVPNNEISDDEINKLEIEEKQLMSVKNVIEDIIRNKLEQKRLLDQDNDAVLTATMHPVKIPHLVRLATTPRLFKHNKPKAIVVSPKDENVVRAPESSESKAIQKGHQPQSRSSDSDDIKKLLRELDDATTTTDDDDEETQLQNRILELQRQLKNAADKKRRKNDMEAQIRFLEQRVKTLENADLSGFQSKSLAGDDSKTAMTLLKRVLQELEKSSRDIDETETERELKKLAESINRLRPKDNDLAFNTEAKNDASTAQFQAMLNRLIAQQNVPQPAPFTPQQMDFLMHKIAPQYQGAPFQNAPFVPAGRYMDFPPFPAQQPSNNFFRDYPKNYPPPPGGYAGANQQQLDSHPEPIAADANPYAKQKIEDLKQQIYNLQGAISNLDNPNYVKKPEDEETIYKLEQQINNLKNVVSGLNQYADDGVADGNYRGGNAYPAVDNANAPTPPKPDNVYGEKQRLKREVGDEETERFMEKAASFLGTFVANEEKQPKVLQRSSQGYESIHERLKDLEKQLGERRKALESKRKSEDYSGDYRPLPTYELETSKLHEIKKEKKLDIFEKVITKIIDVVVDKVAIAIPILIKKLFGISVENLADYNPSDGYGYNSYGSVQSLKDLGIFGYLPLIILKLVDGFTYFINILKKNKFLKNFLVPLLILGGVLGFIMFLIWWLQPDDYSQYGYISYNGDKYYDSKYDYNRQSFNSLNNYDNSRTPVRNINGRYYY